MAMPDPRGATAPTIVPIMPDGVGAAGDTGDGAVGVGDGDGVEDTGDGAAGSVVGALGVSRATFP